MSVKFPDVKDLFEAKSVAVIGASASPGKIGYKLIENIKEDGYKGKLYPVNPKGGEVCGYTIYPTIADIPGEVDIAVVTVPAKNTYDTVVECAQKGVKFLPIITSGFAETGNVAEERRILGLAREAGMRILGPNIFGYFSATASLNATFGPRGIRHGKLAIVTQSGALGIAMVGKSTVEHLGLSAIVSIGNKCDLDEADLLEYFQDQDETKVILLYVEGVQKGERFIEVLKKTTMKKPVVVIKSGRSTRGAMAAASHTGSLAGSDTVFDAIMTQCGVLRAETLKESFNWCRFLAEAPEPQGENAVIITNGGGVGVMATDASEKYGVNLYDDQAKLKEYFAPVTPDFGSTKNPVDITGQAGGKEYSQAIAAALTSPDIHAVMALYCETALFTVDTLSKMICETYTQYKLGQKPIVYSIIGGEAIEACTTSLRPNQAPVWEDVYEAVSCIGALYRWHRYRNQKVQPSADIQMNWKRIEEVIQSARADGRTFLLPHESSVVMAEAGISMPKSGIARSSAEAVAMAKDIGLPVVMKIVSKDIIHKSDAGGVLVNIETEEAVAKAYDTIMANAFKYKADAKIDGIEVNEMIKAKTEVIVGARRDGSFGPTVMFGLGGIYVEVLKDVVFRAWPINKEEARKMVLEIRAHKLMTGARGEKPRDIETIVDTILRLGSLIKNVPAITDMELNPVVVYEEGKGAKALDVRILITEK